MPTAPFMRDPAAGAETDVGSKAFGRLVVEFLVPKNSASLGIFVAPPVLSLDVVALRKSQAR